MRFVVCGAGAIGGILGAQLARAGFDVVFVERNRAHADVINREGLTLKGIAGCRVIPAAAVPHPSALRFQPDDMIVLAVKSGQTVEVLGALRQATPLELPVFCAQNGIRNEELAARMFRAVHGMMVLIGGKYMNPGVVVYTAEGPIGVGAYPSGTGASATTLAKALEKAAFSVYTTDDILAAKWNKLLWNLTSSIQGLTGLSGPEVQSSREGRALMADVMEEGLRVVEAAGIAPVPPPGALTVPEQIRRLRCQLDASVTNLVEEEIHYGSPWQDLFHQRGEVEADFVNGEIVRLGRSVGVPTPHNSLLLRLITEMAAAREPPGKYTVAKLRDALGQTPRG